ncbi:PTS sugar transporter subunit IIA domain-containing protein [Listeria fleischmannii]|uniref:PTS fructose transporter subunit IIA n=1 Tax=Listeria fleischmannii TaxID=1069827 RepID=A0A841YDL3_9LIST|nr:PTS fructose transporter subunit IIA [Listeria fleischmannii]EIA19962.1 PTS system, fructose-specific IIA component [Listeria fleischmannii subsp. coloradonensis]MBC1398415.1 PTS fructose transporter subunit IIA [Listeria fleischmannii]MBC1426476.1 PTS fructose transporter subunit IIA [Listeria fleischmannii]STY46610.1 EIIAB-Man [Listeria fleischmannii subsp. coloradonensis]
MAYILAGHGQYAVAIQKSCQMITGQTELFRAVSFTEDMSVENVTETYRKICKENNVSAIIVDFIGGTPANAALIVQTEFPDVEIVSGLSLSLALQLSLGESTDSSILGAKEMLTIVQPKNQFLVQSDEGEEEE